MASASARLSSKVWPKISRPHPMSTATFFDICCRLGRVGFSQFRREGPDRRSNRSLATGFLALMGMFSPFPADFQILWTWSQYSSRAICHSRDPLRGVMWDSGSARTVST